MPKAAILIDGGYFLKRLPSVRRDVDASNALSVVRAIEQLVHSHLRRLNQIHQVANLWSLLYRCFYYDAVPYANKLQLPVSRTTVDYAKSNIAYFRNSLFAAIRRQPDFALRLGEVRKPGGSSWILKPEAQKLLLNGGKDAVGLADQDFTPAFRQKGVDMRIGLDIAAITLKKQADTIILVAGDSDFVPAAKLADAKAPHSFSTHCGKAFPRTCSSISTGSPAASLTRTPQTSRMTAPMARPPHSAFRLRGNGERAAAP